MTTDTIIYFDHAAATPLSRRVFTAMEPYVSDQFYNPSAAYQAARTVRADYETARHQLAMTIGAAKEEIILTAGATESIAIAFHGVLSGDDEIVIGATEHAAVRGATANFVTHIASSNSHGDITALAVAAAITPKTKLVSVTLADSELGTVQKLREIAESVRLERTKRLATGNTRPLYFHSDASQGAGACDINVARLGVDLLTLNAGKIYGPKQVGLLWVRAGLVLRPLIYGGGQERGIRSGTENVGGAIGFAMALQIAQKGRHSENERLSKLRHTLLSGLQAGVPDMIINGNQKRHLPGHVNISVPGVDAERVVFALDSRGIMVATGAACAANKGTRSNVLEAIGLDDATADGSLRISLGRCNDNAQTERAIPIIIDTINQERGK